VNLNNCLQLAQAAMPGCGQDYFGGGGMGMMQNLMLAAQQAQCNPCFSPFQGGSPQGMIAQGTALQQTGGMLESMGKALHTPFNIGGMNGMADKLKKTGKGMKKTGKAMVGAGMCGQLAKGCFPKGGCPGLSGSFNQSVKAGAWAGGIAGFFKGGIPGAVNGAQTGAMAGAMAHNMGMPMGMGMNMAANMAGMQQAGPYLPGIAGDMQQAAQLQNVFAFGRPC